MKECQVFKVDVFTSTPGKSNSAGIVLEGDQYTEEEMQLIASKVGFNETVFVCSSNKADWRFRFFMPLKETPLCGHGTMGAVYLLNQKEIQDKALQIETQVGILDVFYKHQEKETMMSQKLAQFIPFQGSVEQLCQVVNIEETDLDESLPIMYGSTGLWTLLLPVKSSQVLDKMIPKTSHFETVLGELPEASIHPFTVSSKAEKRCEARHFSAATSGSTEDAVTGTASGVMGAYLLKNLYREEKELGLTVYQGKQMNQEGQVNVYASEQAVNISGTAVLSGEVIVSI